MSWTTSVRELDDRHERIAGYLEDQSHNANGPPTVGRLAWALGISRSEAAGLLRPLVDLEIVEPVNLEGEIGYRLAVRTPLVGEVG